MTIEEAKKLAIAYLQKGRSDSLERLAFVENMTIPKPYGFILFYNSRKYLDTGDRRFALLGNGPLVVDATTREVTALTSAHPPEKAIADYEESRSREEPVPG